MDEDTVIKKTAIWLKSKGWVIKEMHLGHEHGVDIKAFHPKWRKYYYIEAKGEPKDGKSKRAQAENNFTNALGQIVLRIKSEKWSYYGVALPEYYERIIRLKKIHTNARKRLGLKFLIVRKEGVSVK